MALADRNRGQVDPVRHIANPIDVRHRRAGELVDLNAVRVGKTHACRFKTEARNIGPASKCEHDLVDRNDAAVRQARPKAAIRCLDGADHLTTDDLDAALFHLGAQMRAHVVIEATQDVFPAIDHRYI